MEKHTTGNYDASKESRLRGASPLWNRALDKFREELNDGDDEAIIERIGSHDDFIAFTQTIEPYRSGSLTSLGRLVRTLEVVDDFSAVIALCLGANAKMTAFVWGSLRLIITLASPRDEALPEVFDMLEELSLSLPRFRAYEETLPIDRIFESSLVELYSEVICFYARLIRYYKRHPHFVVQRAGLPNLQKDFVSTVRLVKHLSAEVEKQADRAKMRMEKDNRYEQVLNLLQTLDTRQQPTQSESQYFYIPVSASGRFRGREEALTIIENGLDPSEKPDSLKSFALYGMAGVGKTQLALKYALNSKKRFDTILWIAAETSMSLEHSFGAIAAGLGLVQANQEGADERSAIARVKDWLSNPFNERNWLVIFDNADNFDILRQVWPANGLGSVLITSRDASRVSSLASGGMHVEPFDHHIGASILLQLLRIESPSPEQSEQASKIVHRLGGLPLALDQITAFITQRKMRLEDFLPMYDRNAAKIDARYQAITEYPHSLGKVFNMALSHLDGPALHLQNLLAFFEPDSIPESFFLDGAELVLDPDFDFLGDEFELGDAEEVLLRGALINKNMKEKSLSIHRLVQVAVLRQLDSDAEKRYFFTAATLLSLGFPDTWSKDIGHQKAHWTRCEQYLPHVNRLVDLATDNTDLITEPDAWAELLLKCSWYLYEKEQYQYGETFLTAALSSFTKTETLAYANAIDLLGLIYLDMCQPQKALQSFQDGLAIRERLVDLMDPIIAFALNNLAIAYTEIPDLENACEFHRRAIRIRLKNKSDRIGNSYSNYAVTLLRLNQPDAAEEMLMKCPSLADYTDETFLQTDNPRSVGDMVLLSRIRRAQGRKVGALNLASKALEWRRNVHGDRFKTCDSLYDFAVLLNEDGNKPTAMDLLRQLSSIARTLPGGEGQAARAEYKLSVICAEVQRDEEGAIHKKEAERLREIYRPMEASAPFDEAAFNRLNPFMLW